MSVTTHEEMKEYTVEKVAVNAVMGGETNPIVHTTDYVYYKTVSVDKWAPKAGVKLDKKPLRMPAYQECEDELCILGRK
jgi:hypothetical protein